MDKEILDNITNAVSNGRTDIVRTLVTVCEKGDKEHNGISKDLTSDVLLNSLCHEHGSLLHLATKLDHVDIVRTLLSAGADPNVQNNVGETPYDFVQSERMTSVYVEELLKCTARSEINRMHQLVVAGVAVNSQDSPSSGNTALHWAASFGNAEAVQCLLDHGASVNMSNADGAIPLHDAASRKDLSVIRKLLEAGANPLFKCSKGKYKNKTPIDLANDQQDISELLLFYSSSFTGQNNNKDCNGSRSTSIINSSLESLPVESSLTESVGHLSIASLESPMKQSMASYISQPSNLPPFPHLTSPPPLITDSRLHLLWPQPHQIVQTAGPCFKLKSKYPVHIIQNSNEVLIHDILDVWKSHEENFTAIGIECSVDDMIPSPTTLQGTIVCHLNNHLRNKLESYKIIITAAQLRILASDILGLHYGLCTVEQLFSLYQGEDGIPPLYIHDWPLVQCRAVLLDMTLGTRKPTVDTLKGHIKILSSLKIAQLHCFFKFEPKSGTGWPYSNKDLIDIVRYCKKYCLVPIPALDVTMDVSHGDLYDCTFPARHLMTLFCSQKIHLGPNLSKILLESSLKDTHTDSLWNSLSLPSNSSVFLCANGISINAELLHSLPLNVVLVEYGYQADYDYDSCVKMVVLSGLSSCIGVGTSSWGSIAGCPEAATNNIYKAAQAVSFHGALGLIIADWKTDPHHSAICFSWPGLLVAAGLSWNCSIHIDYLHARLPELLNHYVFQDNEQVVGFLIVELGRLEAFVHEAVQNQKGSSSLQLNLKCSALHQVLVDPDSVALDNFTLDILQQAVRHIKRFELDLQKAKPECFQKGEVVAELQLAMDLLLFACRLGKVMVSNGLKPYAGLSGLAVINVGVANLPDIARTDLANRLLALTEQFRGVWLSRNLPCGLHASLYLFNSLLHKLIPENENFHYSADGFLKQQLLNM